MKQTLIFTAIFGFVACGTLDHLYLPANQRSSIGFGAQSNSGSSNQVPILKFASDNNGEGSYRYNYETGNGINAEEQGDARDGTKAHGSYSYTSPEGQHVSITYTADGNGFVPQGSHIPTSPPIPEEILKSLRQNAADEASGIFNEGSYRGEGLSEGQYKAEARTSGGYGGNGGYKY